MATLSVDLLRHFGSHPSHCRSTWEYKGVKGSVGSIHARIAPDAPTVAFPMDLGLSGRRAAVAAASGGLGFSTAAALAAEGTRVAICGRRQGSDRRCGGANRPRPASRWVRDVSDAQGGTAFIAATHVVRVVDYTVDDGRDGETGQFRLFTTMLDPGEVTATELAAAYAQRWEIETVFDELKTHQRGSKIVLRSKSPALVLQEIWGHLCCHYAIRTPMLAAAIQADVDPDRVSFVAALRITRRSLSQARGFPPPGSDHGWAHALVLICQRLNPIRRLRSSPRLIKRKMSKWHVKRARHANWPQPARPPTPIIQPPT
jgi:hypothetical protein